MMANNYQQDGTTLDYLNAGAEAILSGTPVAVGGITGVAHDDIPAGEWGTLHMTGVFVLPKTTEAIATGQRLYLADGKLTVAGGEDAAPNPVVGTAWAAAEAADTDVAVRLGF
ncbi:TPA: DUF2190 family protein [Escherichia coli]|uniref:capsid cement protein n=1 Tax=Escherichia coli TaxID=562 RepID=UPI00131ED366|nr:capsid cement protein [Escherichia coli]EFI2815371.1 DUF2190 family protein [Escherichia coli]EFI2826806.1 DUF2190 family protein [Escherichia coli]EFI2861485.1 DUF2190 family protein [Escherichia coli]EHE2973994.1 DUF2190 family protein [Escherichia coli]ELK5491280.1 DUF2190 family protein [Escherichia coli]